ncbi:MAG: hypothetical protein HOJ48_05015 [Desulfobacula sp.]|jgi:hypothetical protein|nr:hypothetical protein [Desulfobacula sp.]
MIHSIKSAMMRINSLRDYFKGSHLLLLVVFFSLGLWTFSGTAVSLFELRRFTLAYVGITAYVLIPMVIFVLGSLVLRLFEPLEKNSTWIKFLSRIETTAPIIGIIGTFYGCALALIELSNGAIGGEGILNVIGLIGTSIWSSIVALPTGMIAYLLVEDSLEREKNK